jgi:flagellar hook protein FlgE
MISAFQSALSGLHAFGTKVLSNSNNIANASTDGFKRTRVILESTHPHGVKTQIEKINTPGSKVFQEGTEESGLFELSNVDLGRELPEMYLNSQMYKANLKTLQTVDNMLGHLLETKS